MHGHDKMQLVDTHGFLGKSSHIYLCGLTSPWITLLREVESMTMGM